MATIQQNMTFDNYSTFNQNNMLNKGNMINSNNGGMTTTDGFGNIQKTQYFTASNTTPTYQNATPNPTQQLINGQSVVNTNTYLQTPTYSPQALNDNSGLILNSTAVSTQNTSAAIKNYSPSQNGQLYTQINQNPQTISPIEGNGMNFFPTLPIDNSYKNGQMINTNNNGTPVTTTTYTIQGFNNVTAMVDNYNNEQRYPSPPMGAVDINKNQCQTVTMNNQMATSPINIIQTQPANSFISQSLPINIPSNTNSTNGTGNPNSTLTLSLTGNSINVSSPNTMSNQVNAMSNSYSPSPINTTVGFQQYYNQGFTQTIQTPQNQQTMISPTTNMASSYPPQGNTLNDEMNKNSLMAVNPSTVNTAPLAIKTNTRSYNKNNEPISLELALKRQKNTEAARRSRMRKVLKMETLENHVKRLEADNKNLSIRLAMLESNRIEWEAKEKKLLDKIKLLEGQLSDSQDKPKATENSKPSNEVQVKKE